MNYRLLNSDDGFIVEEVDGKQCKYCASAFIYKDDRLYHLIDKDTGLSIVRSRTLKTLEESYTRKKREYDAFRKTDAYHIKVERFSKMKLIHNYKGV